VGNITHTCDGQRTHPKGLNCSINLSPYRFGFKDDLKSQAGFTDEEFFIIDSTNLLTISIVR
jgi:hypothetical protein